MTDGKDKRRNVNERLLAFDQMLGDSSRLFDSIEFDEGACVFELTLSDRTFDLHGRVGKVGDNPHGDEEIPIWVTGVSPELVLLTRQAMSRKYRGEGPEDPDFSESDAMSYLLLSLDHALPPDWRDEYIVLWE
ncbi:MAG: hypothetical protein KDD69_06510 [Bdellovibrionales bacterium]|nr:hypothetical protein [Bdellovibrionales bacterium]